MSELSNPPFVLPELLPDGRRVAAPLVVAGEGVAVLLVA